jgi:hypothetical protein
VIVTGRTKAAKVSRCVIAAAARRPAISIEIGGHSSIKRRRRSNRSDRA